MQLYRKRFVGVNTRMYRYHCRIGENVCTEPNYGISDEAFQLFLMRISQSTNNVPCNWKFVFSDQLQLYQHRWNRFRSPARDSNKKYFLPRR